MLIETWKITGPGAFHFGRQGLGQEETGLHMPSDSLFAALVNRLAVMQGGQAVEAFMQPFLAGEPPFALSSTFPFAGDVRFFPLPQAALAGLPAGTNGKEYKRVAYVSEALFRDLVNGSSLMNVKSASLELMAGRLLVAPKELPGLPGFLQADLQAPLWSMEQRPRVTLGRGVQNSNLFFTGGVTFARGCGLWFGAAWHKEDVGLRDQFGNLCAELGDAGLGAERSVGFGVCRFDKWQDMDLPAAGKDPWVSLSRYLPAEDEMGALTWEGASYKLITVGGWLDSPQRSGQRRRSLHLMEEGAVLGPASRPVPGRVEDVRPSYKTDRDPLGHAVYRSGLALSVAWKGAAQ